ncbi:MAG TPA: 2-amino-4-hydroxy-6-hydroxymethyldihydropteridine diphosphokinase [Bacteroidia bacterium]
MNEVYLCLGGNLGNCLATFKQAFIYIEQKVGRIKLYSSIYQSKAWEMMDAPDFYNQVIKVETTLAAQQLMVILLDIEKALGRERTDTIIGYQNRVIDIDVLFFNNEIIKTNTLQIPHPRLHLRKFVLEPLHEIAPTHFHPLLKKNITELLALCPDNGEVKKQ